MSIEAPKRKTSPSPLPVAREVGAAPRPLSPLRRAAVPLGLAGLLSAAAAAALVNAAANPPCPVPGVAPSGPYTRLSTELSNIVHKFMDPTPAPMAGAMMPVSPVGSSPAVPAPIAPASINPPEDVPAVATPPASTATPTTTPPAAKLPKHIEPIRHHPKLAGKPMPPKLDGFF